MNLTGLNGRRRHTHRREWHPCHTPPCGIGFTRGIPQRENEGAMAGPCPVVQAPKKRAPARPDAPRIAMGGRFRHLGRPAADVGFQWIAAPHHFPIRHIPSGRNWGLRQCQIRNETAKKNDHLPGPRSLPSGPAVMNGHGLNCKPAAESVSRKRALRRPF